VAEFWQDFGRTFLKKHVNMVLMEKLDTKGVASIFAAPFIFLRK